MDSSSEAEMNRRAAVPGFARHAKAGGSAKPKRDRLREAQSTDMFYKPGFSGSPSREFAARRNARDTARA
jgi:hypothetical protein